MNPSLRKCPTCGEELESLQEQIYRCKYCTDMWTYIEGILHKWIYAKKEWEKYKPFEGI